MLKIQKSVYTIFIAVLIQTLLGLSLGLTMLYFSSRQHVASNVYAGGVRLGNLHREEAVKKIDDIYKDIIANKTFTVKYGDNKNFEIKYSDIDAVLESKDTVDSIFGSSKADAFTSLLKGYFSSEKRNVHPILSFNEGKLREKLNELSVLVNVEPINADISLEEGKIVKNHEVNGVRLNVENAVETIKKEIGNSIGGQIVFQTADNYEVETILPRYTMQDLEGLDEVISQYSTKIRNLEVEDSIILAASAISRVKLLSEDPVKRQKAGVFSFNKYLALEDAVIEKNDEGYNQVASTLYAAVLNLGIEMKAITRTPHINPVDYIGPGLDARVLGSTYDFKFENTLGNPMMIFAEIQGDSIKVSIIGKKKDSEVASRLDTEVTQKFSPTVEYLENQEMGTGEKKMISAGVDGVKVKVYRVTSKGNTEVGRQYLYEDEYKAIKAIVEIGPNTHWGEESVK